MISEAQLETWRERATANKFAHGYAGLAILDLIVEVRKLRKVVDAARKMVGLMCKNAKYEHEGCHACALAKALTQWESPDDPS